MKLKKRWVFAFAILIGLTFILGQSMGTSLYAKDHDKFEHRSHKPDKSDKSHKWGKPCKPHKRCPGGGRIAVLNPCGQAPERPVKLMAPRLDTLEGKRIYVTSINFPYTNDFVEELANALQQKYPEAEWVFALKYGTYFMDDQALWQEIQENADAMVLAVGH